MVGGDSTPFCATSDHLVVEAASRLLQTEQASRHDRDGDRLPTSTKRACLEVRGRDHVMHRPTERAVSCRSTWRSNAAAARSPTDSASLPLRRTRREKAEERGSGAGDGHGCLVESDQTFRQSVATAWVPPGSS